MDYLDIKRDNLRNNIKKIFKGDETAKKKFSDDNFKFWDLQNEISVSKTKNFNTLYIIDSKSCYSSSDEIDEKSIHFCELSVDQKSSEAYFDLAKRLLSGKGVKKNSPLAVYYLKKIAGGKCKDSGVNEIYKILSLYKLGRCYEEGIGVRKSIKKAIKYFKSVANSEDPDFKALSLYNLGYLYQEGLYGKKILKKSMYYYKLAVKNGDFNALKKLGDIYFLGQKKPFHKAFQYYNDFLKKEPTNHRANSCIGLCYQVGCGVPASLDQALYYYKRAKEYGSPSAQNRIDKLWDLNSRIMEAYLREC